MRILVLTDYYPPFFEGGYELNCHRVTDGLIARGHEILVLTTKFGTDIRTINGHIHRILYLLRLNYQGVQRRWMQLKYLYYAQQNYWLTRRIARKINPDLAFIWHVQGTSILPILAVQDLGIPTVYRIGSHWLIQDKQKYVDENNRLRKWFQFGLIGFRQFKKLRIDDAIINSVSLKQSYQQAGFNIKRVVMIPSGIPEDWIAKEPVRHRFADGFIKLLYAGRLEASKGTDVAVKAIEYLVNVRSYRNLCFDLIGKGKPEFIDNLKRIVTSGNIENFVHFIDFLSHSDLMQRYKEYDVLLFPTPEWEGLPMTIIEAMSQGLLVVASDIGGPRDIIENGRNGILVPPKKPEMLAAAIEQIINVPSLITEMGDVAIDTVRKKFRFEIMLEKYETFLKSIAS